MSGKPDGYFMVGSQKGSIRDASDNVTDKDKPKLLVVCYRGKPTFHQILVTADKQLELRLGSLSLQYASLEEVGAPSHLASNFR